MENNTDKLKDPNYIMDETIPEYYTDVYSPGETKEQLTVGDEVEAKIDKTGEFDTSDPSIITTNNEYTLSIPNPDGEIFTISISDAGIRTFKIGFFNNPTLAYSTFTTQLQEWLVDYYVVNYSGGTDYNISRIDKTEFTISSPNRTREIEITGTNALTSSTVTIDGANYILENNTGDGNSASDLEMQLNATGLYYIFRDGGVLTLARQDSDIMTISIITTPKYTYTLTGRTETPGISSNQTLTNNDVFGAGGATNVFVQSHYIDLDGITYTVDNPVTGVDYEYNHTEAPISSISKNEIRYIRTHMGPNTASNTYIFWFEIEIMDGATNRALNITPTSNVNFLTGANFEIENITDGNRATRGYGERVDSYVDIDLGAEYTVDSIYSSFNQNNGMTTNGDTYKLEVSKDGVTWYDATNYSEQELNGTWFFANGEKTTTLEDSYSIYANPPKVFTPHNQTQLTGSLLVDTIYGSLPNNYIVTNFQISNSGADLGQDNDTAAIDFYNTGYTQVVLTDTTNTVLRYNDTSQVLSQKRTQLVVGIGGNPGQELTYIFTEDTNEQIITDSEYSQITGSLSRINQNFYIPTQSYPKLIEVHAINLNGESNGTWENRIQKCTRKTGSTTEFVENKIFKTDSSNSGTIEQVKRGGFIIALDTNTSNKITWTCTS